MGLTDVTQDAILASYKFRRARMYVLVTTARPTTRRPSSEPDTAMRPASRWPPPRSVGVNAPASRASQLLAPTSGTPPRCPVRPPQGRSSTSRGLAKGETSQTGTKPVIAAPTARYRPGSLGPLEQVRIDRCLRWVRGRRRPGRDRSRPDAACTTVRTWRLRSRSAPASPARVVRVGQREQSICQQRVERQLQDQEPGQ